MRQGDLQPPSEDMTVACELAEIYIERSLCGPPRQLHWHAEKGQDGREEIDDRQLWESGWLVDFERKHD